MTNNNHFPSHGEGTIQAGEREIHVRFDNRALAQAEQQMGKSVLGVARGFADGDVGAGIVELAQLLRAGMQAARRSNRGRGRPVSLRDAYQVMDAAGFAEVSTVVMQALADVLSYDPNEDDVVDGEFEDDVEFLPDPNE